MFVSFRTAISKDAQNKDQRSDPPLAAAPQDRAHPRRSRRGGGVGKSDVLGGDAGDISYPYYLANGRIPAAPTTFTARPGHRVRIRIINAGSDTAFWVALAGHRMTVTHTDGFPVVPTDVDALLLGMGDRHDVIVTAGERACSRWLPRRRERRH